MIGIILNNNYSTIVDTSIQVILFAVEQQFWISIIIIGNSNEYQYYPKDVSKMVGDF